MIDIQPAGRADVAHVAGLHAGSWRATYRGIMPDAVLDGDLVADRTAKWTARLEAPAPGQFCFLAQAGGQPLGFVAGGDADPATGHAGEVENLHIATAWHGRGLGRRLLATAARHLQATGRPTLMLWFYDANQGAGRFYRSLGAELVTGGFEDYRGARIPHTMAGWTDLDALILACADRAESP